jgi:integrase
MRDTGMRNARELYRMRIENLDWNRRVIFNPNSKTKKGRRFIPTSNRVMTILPVRCADRKEGWVFPSRQKGKHITGGLVNKQWIRKGRKLACRKISCLTALVMTLARACAENGQYRRSHEQHGPLGCKDGHDISAPGIERGT